MLKLTIQLLPIIHKRFMETQQESKSRRLIIDDSESLEQPIIENNPLEKQEEKIQLDPSSTPLDLPNTPIVRSRRIYDLLSPQAKEDTKKDIELIEKDGNIISNIEPELVSPYTPTIIDAEVLLIDTGFKSLVGAFENAAESLGKNIEKNQALAKSWREHMIALQKYLDSLKQLPWKKILAWSAGLLTILGFLWTMYKYRAIPDFLSTTLSLLPSPPNGNTILKETDLPKPNVENTIIALMETPLTPLTIISGIGVLTISVGFLKGLVWILRKAPK